jgi:transposase InsO family protein
MEEKQKIDVAVFRYSVIQDFVSGIMLNHGEREHLLRKKCARKWLIPHSCKTSISRGTIQRWICLYQSKGGRLESLYPRGRNDKGATRVLDDETCLILTQLRKEMPNVTVPFIMKTVEKRGIVFNQLSQSTVYRFFHQQDLMKKRKPPEDRRKFESEHPNDMWQSDVMHGPHVDIDGKQRKSYLIAFIDDHSRLIVYGQFYASENTRSFMHALEQAFLRRGLPRKLYVDNGSAYRSKQLMHTMASLAIALINSRPYKPQGKGKIERFFKTVRSQFLPGFTGTTLGEINLAFEEWLSQDYNDRKHSATGKKPLERFIDGIECIRSTPDNLKEHFRKTVRRKVNNDRTIILDKRLYEGPVELIGKQVELLFHENEYDRVELRNQQKSWGFLKQVDLNVNCRVKRDKNNDPVISFEETTAETGQMWGGKL